MLTVKISSKNQITFPKQLLQAFQIGSGDLLFLQPEKEKISVYPLKRGLVKTLVGAIQVKQSLRGVPFEKVLEETKKMAAKKLK